MEGQFLKMPNGKEGNNFVRKHSDLSEEKYQNIKTDWEKREIRDGVGRVRELLTKYEMKMTARQREILAFVVEGANEILDQYAVREPRASIDLIRVVKDKFFDELDQSTIAGICFPSLQVAVTRGNENITNTVLADNAFHELMHLFSFQRSVLRGGTEDGYADFKVERFGVNISSKDNQQSMYYKQINEAITVELGMRFWKRMHESRLFSDDIWRLERKYGKNDDHTVLRIDRRPDGSSEDKSIVGYPEEYEKTKEFMRYIFEKNKDAFESVDAVMEIFIDAYFSGKLLPIARLVEKTYGKGSFRESGVAK